jgi:glycosyltransferase involved in cell wall biosynthesis
MIGDKKLIVVMPAYNAEVTLEQTYNEIPHEIVDEVVLVDDKSSDNTLDIANKLGITVHSHDQNKGYGANQKSCYNIALDLNADIVVMLHPDYQYTPKLITAMASMIECGEFDVVLGSRILGGEAIKRGMPVYKYISNRILTLIQNLLLGAKLSEYHTGYRAYSKKVLEEINWKQNSDDFIFDNQFLSQVIYFGFRIGELTCPARYFPEASSINFTRSLKYGFGCIYTAIRFKLDKLNIIRYSQFN